MANPYEHLRKETQSILGDSWEHYPAVADFKTVTVYCVGNECIQLRLATQDEFHIVAVSISNGSISKQYSPSRKWGQFESEKTARLWGLGFMLKHLTIFSIDAYNAVYLEIKRAQQLNLF